VVGHGAAAFPASYPTGFHGRHSRPEILAADRLRAPRRREDAFAARARGIATDRVRAFSYLLAGTLGGLAGFAAGQLTFAFFALGLTLTLNGFIALAVGGLGSNLGALVGGAALGLLSSFATYFFGGQYQQTIAVGLLMAVLLLKPEGLFGARQVRPV
jgi:branched-chain amino acid transport system permease protein